MQYRPLTGAFSFFWFRYRVDYPPDSPALLPAELFDLLTGGEFFPAESGYTSDRRYNTEAAAYADLQQAAQALYFSQHQPAQYQNPF